MSERFVMCDGCHERAVTRYEYLEGHEIRYCEACYPLYIEWRDACLAKEKYYQFLLDVFVKKSRESLSLFLVPTDLPTRKPVEGMRLG